MLCFCSVVIKKISNNLITEQIRGEGFFVSGDQISHIRDVTSMTQHYKKSHNCKLKSISISRILVYGYLRSFLLKTFYSHPLSIFLKMVNHILSTDPQIFTYQINKG